MEEKYLNIDEVAERLGMSKDSVQRKMCDGTFIRDVHWFKLRNTRPKFKWSAIVRLIEEESIKPPSVPMRKGYRLGER